MFEDIPERFLVITELDNIVRNDPLNACQSEEYQDTLNDAYNPYLQTI